MTVHPHQPYSPAPPSSAASVAEHIPSYAGSRLIGLRAVCKKVSMFGERHSGARPNGPRYCSSSRLLAAPCSSSSMVQHSWTIPDLERRAPNATKHLHISLYSIPDCLQPPGPQLLHALHSSAGSSSQTPSDGSQSLLVRAV